MEPLSEDMFGKLSKIDAHSLKDFMVGEFQKGKITVQHLTHLPGGHIAENIQKALEKPGRLLFKLTEDAGDYVAKFDSDWLAGKEISQIQLHDTTTVDVKAIDGLAEEILNFEPVVVTDDPEEIVEQEIEIDDEAEEPHEAEGHEHEHVAAADDVVEELVEDAIKDKMMEADRITDERQKSEEAADADRKEQEDWAEKREEAREADRQQELKDAEREERSEESQERKKDITERHQRDQEIPPDTPVGG